MDPPFPRRALRTGDLVERAPQMNGAGAAAFARPPRHRRGQRPVHLEDPRAVAVPLQAAAVARAASGRRPGGRALAASRRTAPRGWEAAAPAISTGLSVTISPPSERRYAASALASACDPPRATGHPDRMRGDDQADRETGAAAGTRAAQRCAPRRRQTSRAFARRERARARAGRPIASATGPNRAISSGWRTRSGPSSASIRSVERSTNGVIKPAIRARRRRRAASRRSPPPSAPPPPPSHRPADARRAPADAPARSRNRASGSALRNGEAATSAWTVAHTSWVKPGSVSAHRPRRAADRRLRLVDADRTSGARERDRRRQSVRARADDDGVQRRRPGPAGHRLYGVSWTHRKRLLTMFHLLWS